MLDQMVYGLHVLTTIVFSLLLVLPFYARKIAANASAATKGTLSFWRMTFHLAHLMIVVALVTGLLMTPSFTSSWFWVVILVFLAMGAFLGISAKSLRLVTAGITNRTDYTPALRKLNRFSLMLSVTIVVMVLLMIVRW
jgi:hypothetical protein